MRVTVRIVFFALALFGMLSPAKAVYMNYNFTINPVTVPGTIEGMFSGESATLDPDITLELAELDSFMVTFTAEPLSGWSSFTLGLSDLSGFGFTPFLGLFSFLGSDGVATMQYASPVNFLFINDGTSSAQDGAFHRATVKVSEPASLGMMSLGLAALSFASLVVARRRKAAA